MDRAERDALKRKVDAAARARAATGYMDCDPETLSRRASEAEETGYPEVAAALRNFRDNVVNPLLGEGWSVERIERAYARTVGRKYD